MAKYFIEDTTLTAMADSIRAKLGTSEKINAQSYADKISEVYDVGYAKGAEEGGGGGINPEWTDWRYFNAYDSRKDLVEKLKYTDTSNGIDFSHMFYVNKQRTKIPVFDTSNGTTFSNMFWMCENLTELPYIDTSKATDISSMFGHCKKLVTIPFEINVGLLPSVTKIASTFISCSVLENVTFKGTLNVTGSRSIFDSAPKVSVDSLMSLLYALSDNTNLTTTYTITIGPTNLAKLTDEQKAIATAKNIKLA